ncbi:MAG: aminotransferase class I/II-fold pyridoxal phosphate-dependent enzyme [Clostridiales bacterium]|jgi:aspartate/methionine/tyrosine aminotransferase|nr:aminotransferase class I/II-fold pyridoxal phosphate-dependent enzyme [Clostridiales bacterium]
MSSVSFLKCSKTQLQEISDAERAKYAAFLAKNLKLDMSRGKPCKEQLDLSRPMLDILSATSDLKTESGIDTRNYALLDGIPEIKKLYAEILGVKESQVIAGGSSSLNMMYDTVQRGMQFGFGGHTPWGKADKIKFLCPAPGYDRHFAVTELLGIEMIPVALRADGPDMDEVERLVAEDESIKGIWCVPRFSNPTGAVYSDAVVKRFAAMKTAAADFRIFWDNAYSIHVLTDGAPELLEILSECEKAGNPDRVFEFTSTSKVTFAGAGVAFFASSENNVKEAKKVLTIQTIGPDKLNQLRHARFLKDKAATLAHMKRHAAILKPKFDAVTDALTAGLKGLGIAEWNAPLGGYFISIDVLDGTAKRVVALAKEAGVALTPAGATFPYGRDPRDRNIRFAPTLPPLDELKTATEIFISCVKIAACELKIES